MFSYFAYGLGIQSELAIPEFIAARCRCDVTIHINKNTTINDYLSEEVLAQAWAINISRKKALFYVKDVGVFLIQGGQKVIFISAPNASEQLIRLCLVGSVMGILLYQRGLLVLHASAVNIDGGAVAFLGKSGEGKSSTAAAFNARGYGIITDDVAPIILGKKPATINPAFPQIKISRESCAAVGYDFESLSLLHPSEEKRGYRPKQKFIQAPLPIRRIYILTSDSELGIEPLIPAKAVVELSRHSRPTTLFHSGDATHFLQCTTLAKEHTIFQLKRPRNLALLPELVNLVEEHITCKV